MRRKKIIFHYTTGTHFPKIMSSGMLRTEKETTPHVLGAGDSGFLWFTASPDWEITANKMWQNPDGTIISLTKEETEDIANGLYRFGVYLGVSFLHWKALKGKIEKCLYDSLGKIAVESGSDPNIWYATTKPVLIEKCCCIEKHDNGRWIAVSE